MALSTEAASKRSRRDVRLLAGAKVHVLHGASGAELEIDPPTMGI